MWVYFIIVVKNVYSLNLIVIESGIEHTGSMDLSLINVEGLDELVLHLV